MEISKTHLFQMEQPPHRGLKKLQVAKQIASVLDAYVETS
jgi:hypothetical protein